MNGFQTEPLPDPELRFDAWAHHPYPAAPDLSPETPETWPEVGVQELTRFGDDVDRAFGRVDTPLWVTEYGESVPAVSRSRQAADLAEALGLSVAVPRVQMFVWLMLRNHPGQPWQSGLRGTPAWRAFSSAARTLDPRNGLVAVSGGAGRTLLRVPVLELRYGVPAGQYVTVSYAVTAGGRRLVGGSEPAAMGRDGWVPFVVRLPPTASTCTVSVAVEARSGASLRRTVRLVGEARAGGAGPVSGARAASSPVAGAALPLRRR